MLKSIDVPAKSLLNSAKILYLCLTIAGTIAPWFWLLQDLTTLMNPSLFVQRVFANNIATAVSNDLLISAIAFLSFVWIELKRLGTSRLSILMYIGLTFGVGLSCALPLFLYRRSEILTQ